MSGAELYNPVTGTWTTTGPMSIARSEHIAILLTNGQVLVAGGSSNGADYLPSAEVYNPSTGFWVSVRPINTHRYRHTFTMLQNGMILAAGGFSQVETSINAGAEVYNLPTLTSFSKSTYENNVTNFTKSDFTKNFNGFCNNSLVKIKIISLPANGDLHLSGNPVSINQEIMINDLGKLTFIPTPDWSGVTSFKWVGSDGTLYATNPAEVDIAVVATNPSCQECSSTTSDSWVTPAIAGGTIGGTVVGATAALVLNYFYNKNKPMHNVVPAEGHVEIEGVPSPRTNPNAPPTGDAN